MDDLISRQDVINKCQERLYESAEELPSAQPEYYDYFDIDDAWEFYAKEQNINLTDGAKQLKDAMWVGYRKGKQDAQSEQRWIPCSERLPEEEKKTYWVCTDTEYQCECRWTNNRFGIGEGEWGWSIFDTPQYTKPIAWMPLPEPYEP